MKLFLFVIKPKTLWRWDHHSIILYHLRTRYVGNDTGTLYSVGTLGKNKWKSKKAPFVLRISVGSAFHATKCSCDKSTQDHFIECMLCFTLTTIDLAYCFWIDAGYNTMVAFPAIVGGAHGYAFIFTHGHYWLL